MTRDDIVAVILSALDDILAEKGLEVDTGPDFQLFGSGSAIDSLDLVGIVVRLEETIQSRTGKAVEIVDENAIITDDSPFRTVDSLAAYAESKVAAT